MPALTIANLDYFLTYSHIRVHVKCSSNRKSARLANLVATLEIAQVCYHS